MSGSVTQKITAAAQMVIPKAMADLAGGYQSRRSNVLGTKISAASNHAVATSVGLHVLEKGGNAADASVAMAATLAVVEPMTSGLGGDTFALFYDAKTRQVSGLNGSGRAGSKVTLSLAKSKGFSKKNPIPAAHGLAVNVPGAPAALVDCLEQFGSKKMTLKELLQPAIEYAEQGFPVLEYTGQAWKDQVQKLNGTPFGKALLIGDRAPFIGEIMKLPIMARTFRELAEKGKEGFYTGRVAEAIVKEVKRAGGELTAEDLANHQSNPIKPISTSFRGLRLWEAPPNGLGINALMALNILEGFNLRDLGHNSYRYMHVLIEALKLSFADTLSNVTDPAHNSMSSLDKLLSKNYAAQRRQLIKNDFALNLYAPGEVPVGTDTTYATAVDAEGNACSFITSIYEMFGSGLVPEGCGFALNNRGLNFNLEPDHPNAIGPNKRSLHTILPAMVTDDASGALLATFGIVGGFMQSQAHVQMLLNMGEFGMNPQEALDAPRVFVDVPNNMGGVSTRIGPVLLEKGFVPDVARELTTRGHEVQGPVVGFERRRFGRGCMIARGAWWASPDDPANPQYGPGVLWAGADPRGDGNALAL